MPVADLTSISRGYQGRNPCLVSTVRQHHYCTLLCWGVASSFVPTVGIFAAGLQANQLAVGGRRTRCPSRAGAVNYCKFAYSTLACFRMGMSGSASFERVKKSL